MRLVIEFANLDARNLNKDIDTVENRSREARTIALYRHRTTGTWLLGVTHETTRTWIHRTDERKTGRISTALLDTIDRDLAIFKWLSKCLEERLGKLEELIEEENSLVSERDFPWF